LKGTIGLVSFGTRGSQVQILLSKIMRWYSHEGYQFLNLPQNFVDDLAEHIVLVLGLDKFLNYEPAVKCEQALAGGPVTSVLKNESTR
jgi:hypothetical protein